jgi:uncharacterized membrane protein YdbT with pleckstrin-like domain
MSEEKRKKLWRDRKRNFLGLPWTFTVYDLNNQYLRIQTGILNSRYDRVNLYRVTDITVTRSLWQRIIGTGTLHVDSADKTMKNFDIINVRHPMEVEEVFSDAVERARKENRVYTRESMGEEPQDLDNDGIPDDVDDDQDIDEENH